VHNCALNCNELVDGTPSGLLTFCTNAPCPKEKSDEGCEAYVVTGKLNTGEVVSDAHVVELSGCMKEGLTAKLLTINDEAPNSTDFLLPHSVAVTANARTALEQLAVVDPSLKVTQWLTVAAAAELARDIMFA